MFEKEAFLNMSFSQKAVILMKQTYSIRAVIEKLAIPADVPYALFLKWEGDEITGRSRLFFPQEGFYDVEEKLNFFEYSRGDVLFSCTLMGKSVVGELVSLGQLEVKVPDEVFAGACSDFPLPIETKVGHFELILSFSILSESSLPCELLKERDEAETGRYCAKVEALEPVLYSERAIRDVWGKDGLFAMIEYYARCNVKQATLEKIAGLEGRLKDVLKQSESYKFCIERVLKWLMKQHPCFLSTTNDIVQYDPGMSVTDGSLMPIVGIEICCGIDKLVYDFNDMDQAARWVMDVCSLIVKTIDNTKVSDEWLVYFVSSTYFAVVFVQNKYKRDLENVLDSLLVVSRHALGILVTRECGIVREIVTNPDNIKAYLDAQQAIFDRCAVPAYVWQEINCYIYDVIDYYAASTWILTGTSDTVNVQSYTSCFPKYNWPLLTGLDAIIANCEKIAANKYSLKEIPGELKGRWLQEILMKMKDVFGRKLSEKNINALVGDNPSTPTIVGITRFVETNWAFENPKMKLPNTLPIIDF